MDDGALDDNVESYLSHDDADARERVGHLRDASKGGLLLLLLQSNNVLDLCLLIRQIYSIC